MVFQCLVLVNMKQIIHLSNMILYYKPLKARDLCILILPTLNDEKRTLDLKQWSKRTDENNRKFKNYEDQENILKS